MLERLGTSAKSRDLGVDRRFVSGSATSERTRQLRNLSYPATAFFALAFSGEVLRHDLALPQRLANFRPFPEAQR